MVNQQTSIRFFMDDHLGSQPQGRIYYTWPLEFAWPPRAFLYAGNFLWRDHGRTRFCTLFGLGI